MRKCLEPTVNASIIKYLTNNNLLSQNKGDFRPNDSVDTNLTTTATATTTTNNSLQHQATWGKHSYAYSSCHLIYLKPPSLHPPR